MFPGQACAYKIGQLKLLELRAKAQQSLGSRVSLAGFHTAGLRAGNVPLEVLEAVVDACVSATR